MATKREKIKLESTAGTGVFNMDRIAERRRASSNYEVRQKAVRFSSKRPSSQASGPRPWAS